VHGRGVREQFLIDSFDMEPTKQRYIYVLRLKGGMYYVGSTNDVDARFAEHMAGEGAEWTRKYEPLSIEHFEKAKDEFSEDNMVKRYMTRYGVDNVRGGSYCQLELSDATRSVLEFESRGRNEACYRCGKVGHFARACTMPNVTHLKSRPWTPRSDSLPARRRPHWSEHAPEPEPVPLRIVCYRCGWPGHLKADCFAKKHRDGGPLM